AGAAGGGGAGAAGGRPPVGVVDVRERARGERRRRQQDPGTGAAHQNAPPRERPPGRTSSHAAAGGGPWGALWGGCGLGAVGRTPPPAAVATPPRTLNTFTRRASVLPSLTMGATLLGHWVSVGQSAVRRLIAFARRPMKTPAATSDEMPIPTAVQ